MPKNILNNRSWNGFEVAVIGMSGRFPKANSHSELWENLCNSVDGISELSDAEILASGVSNKELQSNKYVKAKGSIDNTDSFDFEFFNDFITDASISDPQVRTILECIWEAFEDAGYVPDAYKQPIGLYAGASPNIRWQTAVSLMKENNFTEQFSSLQLHDKDFLSMKVAYKLNLRGPAITFYTACSTSLVAVDLAVQGILTGRCEMAVVGGVSIDSSEKKGYMYEEGMFLSKDGKIRSFDKNASGTVFCDGAGVVILKKLDDAIRDNDNVISIIKGSYINNDGNVKVGMSAPGFDGQVNVAKFALRMAEVEPNTISYIEANGTGSQIGDQIEFDALKKAYSSNKEWKCPIGSLKSNIGHLHVAGGVASLIKVSMAMQNQKLVPNLHYNSPNSGIDIEKSPFYVNTELRSWQRNGSPLRAGINSFGVGGTNAHLILEEGIKVSEIIDANKYNLIVLSAKSVEGLKSIKNNLSIFLKKNTESLNISDVAFTLQIGRKHFQHREMFICSNASNALDILSRDNDYFEIPDSVGCKSLFFTLSNSYNQNDFNNYIDSNTVFKEAILECSEYINTCFDLDFESIIVSDTNQADLDFKSGEFIYKTLVNATLQYASVKALISWGVIAEGIISDNSTEIMVACVAGVINLQAAFLLLKRQDEIKNAEPCSIELNEILSMFKPENPSIPYVSGLTGNLITSEEINSIEYWNKLVNEDCSANKNNDLILKNDDSIILNIGKKYKTKFSKPDKVLYFDLEESCDHTMLSTLGNLWLNGAELDFGKQNFNKGRRRVSLPTYPFERKKLQKINLNNTIQNSNEKPVVNSELQFRNIEDIECEIHSIWAKLLGVESINLSQDFISLGGDSLKAIIVIQHINKTFNVNISIKIFYELQTIKEIAKWVNTARKEDHINIPKAKDKPHYPMSFAQKRMYVAQLMDDKSDAYNINGALVLEGELDINELENAFNKLIEKHESLRTSFEVIDDTPHQVINENIRIEFEHLEASEEELEQTVLNYRRPFNLSIAPLLRIALVKVHATKHVIVIDIHHSISDEFSLNILMFDVMSYYNSEDDSVLQIQYKDFSEWQNKSIKTAEFKKIEKYWLNKFSGDIPKLNIPTDFDRPDVRNINQGGTHYFNISKSITEKLRKLVVDTQSSMYIVLLSFYKIVLFKLTNQNDIVVGTPILGRERNELRSLIGVFINMIAIRSFPRNETSIAEFIEHVKQESIEAYENQAYPFDMLVQKLNLQGTLNRNPLFDTEFAIRSINMPEFKIPGIKAHLYEKDPVFAKFDLHFLAIDAGDQFKIKLRYSKELFKPETIEELSSVFIEIIEKALCDLNQKLSEVSISKSIKKSLSNVTETEMLDF